MEKEFIYREHSPVFYQIIETKIAFLKEYLEIMEANPTITLDELAGLVDQRLETEERAMDESTNVFETDKIFNIVRILGWIKYLITEKNGRVPSKPDCDCYLLFLTRINRAILINVTYHFSEQLMMTCSS